MGDRDPGVGGGGDPGGDPGDDLELDPGLAQGLALLAAAAEDEGVAALEPDDALPLAGGLDQPLVDLLLRHRGPARAPCRRRRARRPRGRRRARRGGSAGRGRSSRRSAISSSERAVIRPGSPGPGADQIDDSRPGGSRPLLPRPVEELAGAGAEQALGEFGAEQRRLRRVALDRGRGSTRCRPAGRRRHPAVMPSGRRIDLAADPERAGAGRVQQGDDGALGGQLAQGGPIGDRLDQRASVSSSPSRICSRSEPWPAAGVIDSLGSAKTTSSSRPSLRRPGGGEHDRVELALRELAQPGVDVAVQLADLEVGARGQQLRAAPQARGADAGALGHIVERGAERPARRRRGPPAAAPRPASGPRSAPPGRPWPSGRRGRPRRRAAPARPPARSGLVARSRRRRRPRPARPRPASRPPGPA